MKQSQYLIAGACVVGIGIGYLLGGNRATDPGAAEPADRAGNIRQAKSGARERPARGGDGDELLSSILKGRPPQDLSDDELVAIVQQLGKYDPMLSPVARARQSYQLQLLLAKLPAARLEEIAETLAADPESKRSGGLNTIVSAMASKDAHRAMEWAKGQNNASMLLASVLGTMAKDDPLTAAEIYRNGLLDGTFSPNDGWQASYGIATAMARLGKTQLLNFLDSLPKQQQGNLLSNSFRELPEGDRGAMLDEIYQRSKDGRIQDYGFTNLFNNAMSSGSEQAEAWLEKMEPGEERASLELSTATNLLRMGDSEAAREWMSRAISQSQGREKELLKEAVDQMAYSNSGDIAVFASLLPQGVELLADDLKNQARNTAYRGFSGLTGLAAAIRDPAEQTKLITGALDDLTERTLKSSDPSRLNATDFEILTRQLQTLNLSGENLAHVEEALAAARSATPKPKE